MPGTIRHRKEGRKEGGRRERRGSEEKERKEGSLKTHSLSGSSSVAGEKEADLDIGSQPC